MKKHIFSIIMLMTLSSIFAQNSDLVFRSNTLAEIRITIDQDKLDWVYANVDSDSLHMASMTFHNETLDVSLDSIGFRLRGNTSRDKYKKPFKLDLNEFVRGQDIVGIEKLNLRPDVNDPSMARSKICADLFEAIGLPTNRIAYTKVYINDNYMGLYLIHEHNDENFLSYHYGNNNGNLWKCTWPADLNYRGPAPQDYWPFSDEGPYELKTNVDEFDYSELAHLIDVINNSPSSSMKTSLESVLNVTDFIKYIAVNLMTGSWDDYRFLRNNYYLYHDPESGQFRFIPYDYDNTFGIDWVNGDWAIVNMYNYPPIDNDGRPLTDLIMNDPEYRNLYTHFVDFYTNKVFRLDQWQSRIESIKAFIRPEIASDPYYPLDFNYTLTDFDNAYNTEYRSVSHVERGIYEFMQLRRQHTNAQIEWQSVNPSIYRHELAQTGRYAHIDISAFDHEGISSVSLYTYDQDHALISTVAMNRNRVPGTTLVEEYDQWSIDHALADNERYYKITALDSSWSWSDWPRSGYAAFDDIHESDQPLFINEFMASNDAAVTDPAGEYDDWVEIYNASQSAIDMGGMFLTDKQDNLDKWDFPNNTIIDAGGFLVIWCDEDGDKPQAGLHANFKLSAGGEFLALVDSDSLSIIDHLTFGEQSTDIAYARISDGGEDWSFTSSPTPGYSNIITAIDDVVIPVTSALLPNYPNPFNPRTTVSYLLSKPGHVELNIYDLGGHKITTLFNSDQNSGTYLIDWYAGSVASGVYLAVLKLDNELIGSQKMLLIK